MITCGEECQLSAKTFSSFINSSQGSIPPQLVRESFGLGIFRGREGVCILRLPTGDWSAPCAISLDSSNATVQPLQETILLFMSENAIYSLVTRARLSLNETHVFAPGPLNQLVTQSKVDVYVYVRFNGGFTPADLIASFMTGWTVKEDVEKHERWHGHLVSWFDVLTNKITVDRSSVGNALYLVLNLAAGSASESKKSVKKNYADVESWSSVAPSSMKSQEQSNQQQDYNSFAYPQHLPQEQFQGQQYQQSFPIQQYPQQQQHQHPQFQQNYNAPSYPSNIPPTYTYYPQQQQQSYPNQQQPYFYPNPNQ